MAGRMPINIRRYNHSILMLLKYMSLLYYFSICLNKEKKPPFLLGIAMVYILKVLGILHIRKDFFFFFLIDKKKNILKRATNIVAQGIQNVFSYHQPPP